MPKTASHLIAKEFHKFGKKIIAIGKNYADHAKEMGGPVPTQPMFFLKPTTSFLRQPYSIELPKGAIVHHEVELGVVINENAKDVPTSKALGLISGYVLALDMTARNIQEEARKKGYPWTVAKGFDTFTPISDFVPKELVKDPHNLDLWLKVDGELKQQGSTKDMVFSIPELIAYISSVMTLEKGDLILTGTPAGVGPVQPSQVLTGGLMIPNNNHSGNAKQTLVGFEFPVSLRSGTGVFAN